MLDRLIRFIGNTYFSYFLGAIIMTAILRIAETLHLLMRFNPPQLYSSELLGWLIDIFQAGLVLCLVFPLHQILIKRFPGFGIKYGWYLIGFFVFMHITISEYFFYQQRPLDVFVFKHKAEEMVFSVSTADSHILLPAMIKYSVVMLIYFIMAIWLYKCTLPAKLNKVLLLLFIAISLTIMPVFHSLKLPVAGNLVVNKSTFLYVNSLKELYLMLTDSGLKKYAKRFQTEFPGPNYTDPKFPFLHLITGEDRLSKQLDKFESPPHIVLIIVEGLADDFIHPMKGGLLMPFMDSLSRKSLYWDRCLSNSERSFGATPSLNGSLPFGNNGFALMDKYPYHFSLVNVLKENHYRSRFFYGQGAWFHGKEPFYQFNNIDEIIDKEDFSSKFTKVFVGKEKFFWGYNDFDLFNQYFLSTPEPSNNSRYDVFFTGTSHAPFAVNDENHYRKKYRQITSKISDPQTKQHYQQYSKYYTSLLNVDDALKHLFDNYSKREDYCNTLFIVTGDHPITEIPVNNPLKKYHVPLIIYSPLLKETERFHEVCSHLDLYQTLMPYLRSEYDLRVPVFSTALGEGLKFEKTFNQAKVIPLMTDNRRIEDFFYHGLFISESNRMFKVDENFELHEYYNNKSFQNIYHKLKCYQAASVVATEDEYLLPVKIYDDFFQYKEIALFQRNEQMSLSEDGIVIFNNIPCEEHLYYLDVTVSSWNFFNFAPNCILNLKDKSTGKILQTFEVHKSGSTTVQFHVPIKIPEALLSKVVLEVKITDKEGGLTLLSSLKARLYYKQSGEPFKNLSELNY
ncbi:MAG: LTA synthase family protein [Saprospiraceae bacterium]|nr:LTA synthase family protein [Saprospiraceae bacterium]